MAAENLRIHSLSYNSKRALGTQSGKKIFQKNR